MQTAQVILTKVLTLQAFQLGSFAYIWHVVLGAVRVNKWVFILLTLAYLLGESWHLFNTDALNATTWDPFIMIDRPAKPMFVVKDLTREIKFLIYAITLLAVTWRQNDGYKVIFTALVFFWAVDIAAWFIDHKEGDWYWIAYLGTAVVEGCGWWIYFNNRRLRASK